MSSDAPRCGACNKQIKLQLALWCAQCKKQAYCGRDCQKEHWRRHKKACEEEAKRKQEAEELLRKLRLDAAEQSAAARGPVSQDLVCADVEFSPEGRERRLAQLLQLAECVPKGERGFFIKDGKKVSIASLHEKALSLLEDSKFADICEIANELVQGAFVCLLEANFDGEMQAEQFSTAMEIWYILGQTMFKVMDYRKACKYLLRAEDAATHMRMQKVEYLWRLLEISVHSLQSLTKICLEQADEVLETKLCTFKYAYPLLKELNERCKALASYPEIAVRNMPTTYFLAAWAFKNVLDYEQADKSLQDLSGALQYLEHVDEAEFFVCEVYRKFMIAQVHMQQKNFGPAMNLCGEVIHEAHEHSICPDIVVRAYFLATLIDIAVDYDRDMASHAGYTRANKKLKGARDYLEAKSQELRYHLPQLNHRLHELQTELDLRYAVFMWKTLKPHKKGPHEQEDRKIVCVQLFAALEEAVKLPVRPMLAAPFFGKSNVFKACTIVLLAQMSKKVLTTEQGSNWEENLTFADNVLRPIKNYDQKLADNQSSLATLFLAYLIALREGPEDCEACAAVLQYLDETITSTMHQKDEAIVVCFCCGKVMQGRSKCANCKTVHYCSKNCQNYDNLSLHKGGLLFKPAHNKVCALFKAYRELNKVLTKLEGATSTAELIRSITSQERQMMAARHPMAKKCLEKLNKLMIGFLREFCE